MAQWFMKCAVDDLDVMGSNPGQVELRVQYFCLSRTWTKDIYVETSP